MGSARRTVGRSSWPPVAWARSTPRRPTRRSPPATGWRSRCGPARSWPTLEFVQFHPTVLFLGDDSTGPAAAHFRGGARGGGVPRRRRRGALHAGRASAGRSRAPRCCVARDRAQMAAETGSDHVFLDCPPPGCGVPREAVPVDRRVVSRARLRPGDRPAAGRAGPALRQRWGAHRPARPLLAPGLYACGECSCTGRPRRQPAGVQLAVGGSGLRPPDRRGHHPSASPRGSCLDSRAAAPSAGATSRVAAATAHCAVKSGTERPSSAR
jgi:hypothetical protein